MLTMHVNLKEFDVLANQQQVTHQQQVVLATPLGENSSSKETSLSRLEVSRRQPTLTAKRAHSRCGQMV